MEKYVDLVIWNYFAEEKVKAQRDVEFDNLLNERIEEVSGLNVAKTKLGIRPEDLLPIEPISFRGFRMGGDAISKRGADEKFRSSEYGATWIFFGRDRLYLYDAFIDLLHYSSDVKMFEYLYKSIDGVCYTVKNYRQNKVDKKGRVLETIAITDKQMDISVGNTCFSCKVIGAPNADELVEKIKKVVRDGKNVR